MRRISLISSRPTRALRDRPATDTRLSPFPFPTRRWKVHRPHAANPSLGSLLRLRPLNGVLTPGHRPGGRPDTLGSPEATAPRLDSPVASLGTPLSHGDGKEDTPDPLRRVESVWGSYPFRDSPVSNLGDAHKSRDDRESALPSLRMVERFPHTDRPEVSSSPIDLRVWCSLAPRPLRPGHGPSIAYTPLPVIPAPDRESIPGAESRGGVLPPLPRGERVGVRVIPSPASGAATTNQRPSHCHSDAPRGIPDLPTRHSPCQPSPIPSIELEAEVGAEAPTSASVHLSPSPLKALRERGIKGVRVPFPPPAPCEIPRNPFRRHSIKPATSSINVQSKSQQPPHV